MVDTSTEVKKMNSVWSAECQIEKRIKLSRDIETDTVVIGAGMAGILTAFLLQEKGIKVVVVEGNEVASGMTKNTTAKITAQHNLIYSRLIKEIGLEKAKQYARANVAAIKRYKDIIDELNIDCHYEEMPAYVYSLRDKISILDETNAAISVGIDAEYTETVSLPFKVKAAVKFNNQAQFNPLEFISVVSKRLDIYEHTMVREVKDNVVITDNGNITARNIVVATHYPFINVPGYYFLRMYQKRSYVLALENVPLLDGMYKDESEKGYSFRNYKDYVIFGGEGHKTGEKRLESSYEKLRKAAKEIYPDSKEVYNWSAQDCTGLDEIPYIGRYSAKTPHMYVATGFNKWGMTSSMVSAMIISDMITEKENENADVFSPQRFNVTASAKNLYEQGKETVTSLMLKKLVIPSSDIEHVANNTGAIIEYEGHKVGVYKDGTGKAYFVSTTCTHLGCQLEWNPDELSWDCPCHGSRFDYEGNLINNPALVDLKKGE
ncbi:MAG: iron-sulfur cluster-binding protein rieske family [Clostridiales bacterium]|jgi:glycine/D-amino acid oxidase-like deaminating enzyme/nitrite reductase/ring-hydroxylating ferredoxin subunit|nr:iron-sulfur cluster-binding protein rieske family [Clostridiales bacterium]